MLYLQFVREQRGWTRAEMGRQAHMQPSMVAWIETQRFIPYPTQLQKLAAALGVEDPSDLMKTMEG